ncbi:MAG: heavy metal-responsive transcriptional regulator [Gemmatimonadaceae bacterium]|nr:heavy metal-responsive transcriptional regulator [Gemmatimonadaceae bacterium]
MKIGDIATAAGVPTATVRFYERRGLIPRAPRTPAGYRKYGGDTARRLQFIKHAKELGFSLDDIQTMLELRTDDPAACRAVEALAQAKVQAVREHLRELRRLERILSRLVQKCEEPHAPAACPILEVLGKPATRQPAPAPGRRLA